MFNGHMDTSYSGSEPHLTGKGFKPRRWSRAGASRGLGISNMKGALACYVEALRALLDAGVRLRGDLMIAAVVGEIEKAQWGDEFRGPRTAATRRAAAAQPDEALHGAPALEGKWNVFVDIDELFDYPELDRLDLRGLLGYLSSTGTRRSWRRCSTCSPPSRLRGHLRGDGRSPSAFPYFDISDISKRPYEFDDDPDSTLQSHHGGIRRTVFGSENCLTKAAVTFVDDEIETFVGWHHVRQAPVRRHLLRAPALPVQPDVLREGGGGGPHVPIRTRRVARVPRVLGGAARRPEALAPPTDRAAVRDVQQLVDLGFLQVSDQYRRWVPITPGRRGRARGRRGPRSSYTVSSPAARNASRYSSSVNSPISWRSSKCTTPSRLPTR